MAVISFLSKEARFVQRIHNRERRAERDFFDYCYNYCMRAQGGDDYFSKDRFQDAFIQIWTEIQDGRIFLKGDVIWRQPKAKNAVAAPMSCSLRSFIVDICKKQKAKENRGPVLVVTTTIREITEEDWDDFKHEDEEEQLRIVHTGIEEMPPHCREILTEFYINGLSLEQIMRKRGAHVSKDGLKTSKNKCLKRLREAVISIYISIHSL